MPRFYQWLIVRVVTLDQSPVVYFWKGGTRLVEIAPDATIADITHLLADAEEYVRRVMENMMSGPYDRDEAVVRIGVSGTGVAPNYKIEYPRDQPDLVVMGHTLRSQPAETHSGRSHKGLRHLDDLFRGERWSTRTMSFVDLQNLIGMLRAKRKSR